MKLSQMMALMIIAAFYTAYLIKMLLQKRRGIRTHQINRGIKPPETRRVERIMGFATVAVVAVELLSIIFSWQMIALQSLQVIGLTAAALGVVVFVLAMTTMKDSWRAGINEEEKTCLVTCGIYQISRNPAFLGFDLVYFGILAAFFNIPLLCITTLAVVSLHLQICREEVYLEDAFGEEYSVYKKNTCRYLGKRRAGR